MSFILVRAEVKNARRFTSTLTQVQGQIYLYLNEFLWKYRTVGETVSLLSMSLVASSLPFLS